MEEAGVITGYTVRIDPAAIGFEAEHLATVKAQTDSRGITKEITDKRTKLKALEARQAELKQGFK